MKKINKIFSLSLIGMMLFSVFAIFFPQETKAQVVVGSDIFTDNCQAVCVDINTPDSEACKGVKNILGAKVPPASELFQKAACTVTVPDCTGSDKKQTCCCEVTRSTNPNDYYKAPSISPPKYDVPDLQIKLPINFGQVKCTNNDKGGFACTVSWIGDYVSYVYRYGLSVAGILAAMVMMAGGLMWLTSGGDSGQVSKAKSFISGSVIGLIVLFSTYMILYQINPELTTLDSINIGYKSDGIVGDSSIPVDSSTFSGGQKLFVDITQINCGTDSYEEMMKKASGKIVYSQGKRMTAAPDNKIYMDCSSFANLITVCAGKPSVPDTTETMFVNQPLFDGNINNLKVGDLVGWRKSEAAPGRDGHVYIYLGNGKFGDVNGYKGGGVGSYDLSFVLNAVKRHTGQDRMPYVKRP